MCFGRGRPDGRLSIVFVRLWDRCATTRIRRFQSVRSHLHLLSRHSLLLVLDATRRRAVRDPARLRGETSVAHPQYGYATRGAEPVIASSSLFRKIPTSPVRLVDPCGNLCRCRTWAGSSPASSATSDTATRPKFSRGCPASISTRPALALNGAIRAREPIGAGRVQVRGR